MKKGRIVLGVIIFLLIFFISFCAYSSAPEHFCFAHISDTHILSEKNILDLKSVLNHILTLPLNPVFVINTGDITEYGYPEEFEAYNQIINTFIPRLKFYNASGNHDTRWSNAGKQNFRRLIGETNFSFDYGGVHFVVLDSSMLIEQYAHFEKKDLDWLEADLRRQSEDKPVIIAFHHPPFLENLYIDNEYELLQTIEKYNVVLVLMGHIHQHKIWRVNGIHFATTAATMQQQGFRLVEVTSQTLTLYSGSVKSNALNRDMVIPLKKSAPPEITILPVTSKNDYTLVVTTNITDNASTCSYTLNSSREFKPLKQVRSGLFAEQIPYRELSPGNHKVVVRLSSEKSGEWRKMTGFEIPHRKNKVLFAFQTQAAIQSSPVISGKRLYVGSNDGNIYCINSKNGKLLWQFKTGAEVIAVPAVEKNVVYTGSLDGNFYALDARTGKTIWCYPVGAPVLASATVSRDKVFFGAGDFKLRALAKKDGTLLWEFPTGRLIKMKPAVAGDKILFGSWDGYFYCLNINDGKLIWKEQISANPLYAPATSNPLIVENKVIFVAHNYTTHCLDIETGKRLWNFPGTDESKPSYNSGAYFENSVFFGSITGHLVSFNVNDGKLRFATPLKSLSALDLVFDSSPLIYQKTAFLGSIGGNLYGVDCQTGQLKWQFSLQNGYIFSSPVINKGILYVGDCAGKLYAIKFKL